ncbi:MAG: hypothetical protein ACLT24_22810, partial [Klebsiella sp.]
NHPQDADPAAKVKSSVGLHYYRYRVSRQAWPGLKRYADSSAAVISNSNCSINSASFFPAVSQSI